MLNLGLSKCASPFIRLAFCEVGAHRALDTLLTKVKKKEKEKREELQ